MSTEYTVVPYARLYLEPTVPPDLSMYIDQGLWQELRIATSSASENGNMTACLGEICCCFLTGFWCIFFLHPCFVDYIKENQLRQELSNINYTRFHNNPVLMVVPHQGIEINFNYIVNHMPVSQPDHVIRIDPMAGETIVTSYASPSTANAAYSTRPGEAVEAVAVPVDNSAYMGASSSQGNSKPSGAVMATIVDSSMPTNAAVFQAQASNSRTMLVTLPPNVYPYAVLRVQSPEGLQVSITVPRDATPGKQIQVRY